MFDGLLYINIPRLSHNGMENPRTTVKKNVHVRRRDIGVLDAVWSRSSFFRVVTLRRFVLANV